MNTTSFIIRNHQSASKNINNVDYLDIIEKTLSASAFNRIITNSPLYLLAVSQYNTKIINTLDRPPIPKWFCGKVETSTGNLIPTYDDTALRAANALITTIPSSVTYTPLVDTITYDPDKCLSGGVPGSAGYSYCLPSTLSPQLSFTSVISGVEFDNLFNLVF